MDARRRKVLRIAVMATALVLAVLRFIAIDRGSHSASDTLRPWGVEVLVIGVVAWFVADRVGS